MTPIRTILHATDFSAPSDAALELACSLARGCAAKLVILHVAAPETNGGGVTRLATDPRYYEGTLRELRERVVGSSPGFPVETCTREGQPADEILRAADDLGADLIVLGSHGRTGLTRLLMGSVAEAVMRRAGCPVLLAKHAPAGARDTASDRAASTPAPGRVIVSRGRCACGFDTAHVIHHDFPEHWAEGDSVAAGAASLEDKLRRARENCPTGWHYDDLTRAIEDVHAFRSAHAPADEPKAHAT